MMFTQAFIILLLSMILVTAASYSLFLLSPNNKQHIKNLPFTNLQVVWGIITSIPSLIATYILYPFALIQGLWLSRDAQSDKPPVLFVHGYIHTSSAWVHFARTFAKAGYTDQHAFSYRSFATDFDVLANRLEKEIETISAQRPGKKIVLVGHSLGGLAIRNFLNTSPNRNSVCAAVTLGSPHQGSTMAKLALTKLGRQLRYEGDLVKRIAASDKPPPCPCLALFSPTDNMVMPAEGLRIRTEGWKERQVSPVCHVGMLYHGETQKEALKFISEALAKTPSAHTAEDNPEPSVPA